MSEMKFRKGDQLLVISQDIDPMSPREWDNTGMMVCFHRGYDFPNELKLNSKDFEGWDEIENYLYKKLRALTVLPLYLYDHSGITMSTHPFSCPWDSGQVGLIYTTRKKMREMGFYRKKAVEKYYPGLTLEQIAKKILESEIETYDQYLRGDIYGFNLYKVTECELGHEHQEDIDSCWGFYGDNWKENGLLEHTGITDFEDWKEAE